MKLVNVPYLPGEERPTELPLGRFLPPIPPGMAKTWCRANLNPGDWVLEPFGSNPQMVIEIANAGYPVLVCVNNPIHAFLLQVLASSPQRDELVTSLQDLAFATKGDDRMENYIRSFYNVECTICHHQVEAEAFLWKKGEDKPYASLVNCPVCGTYGEQLLNDETLKSIKPLSSARLHFVRALTRVVDQSDPLRKQVESILQAYPVRSLIILQTIFNKLEMLNQTPRRRELLIALIISASDYGNTLWAYPSPRHRPKQVIVPGVYQEKNLWKALESAITTWQVGTGPVPVHDWIAPPVSRGDGIYLYQGRIKELQPSLKSGFFSAAIAAIPRPNQAFWSLSALWTGWIWGSEAVSPIRQVLRRQRYDWNWHCNALMRVFESLYQFGQPSLKFFGIIAENEPMLLLSCLLAADAKGFKLDGFAQSIDDQIAQCHWQYLPNFSIKPMPNEAFVDQAAADYLHEKGEPASFQQIHSAVITKLAANNNLAMISFLQNVNQAASETQRWLETILQKSGLLKRIDEGHTTLEAGEWWLTIPPKSHTTITDQLEKEIYRLFVNAPIISSEQIQQIIYRQFPGIFTPENELVSICLLSYALQVDPKLRLWELRKFELPIEREKDKSDILGSLKIIAHKLGYRTSGSNPILWHDEKDPQPHFHFDILTSAVISPYLDPQPPYANTNLLVIPGSRANLLAYKKQRDPILKENLDRNFYVIKYRQVRDLEVNPLLSRELFNEQILTDPPEYSSTQLPLL